MKGLREIQIENAQVVKEAAVRSKLATDIKDTLGDIEKAKIDNPELDGSDGGEFGCAFMLSEEELRFLDKVLNTAVTL